MTNLLRADFFRLRRDRSFWICIAAVLIMSAGMVFYWCWDDVVTLDSIKGLEYYYFLTVVLLGLFQSVFGCLFLNTEYGEGTVRNKLSVGHTRREVYLSHFFTIEIASLLMVLLWAVGGCVGIPFAGIWQFGFDGLAFYILVIVAFSTVYAAAITFIGVLCTGRSAIILTILAWLVTTFAAITLLNALHQAEQVTFMSISEGVETVEMIPNPHYIAGTKRDIYEFLMDLLPFGQALQVQDTDVAHPVRVFVCDVVSTLAFTLGGLMLFRKKDLK